jgi:hypothetical protein
MPRLLLPVLLVSAGALPAQTQLNTPKIPTYKPKHRHIVDFKCEGQPDKVVGRRNQRYFGCVNGKVVCSDDAITESMIAEYEANVAQFLADAERRKQEVHAKLGKRLTSHSSPNSTSAITIKSTPRPSAQAEPIEADKVRQVAVGTSTDEVISMLGQPKWRLAGSTEKWTYTLTSGGSAKLLFKSGKVTSVVLP